jgi:hypothetical protein
VSEPSFSLRETALIAGFACVATWVLASSPARPPVWVVDGASHEAFIRRFGPEKFSAGLEEYMVRDFFQDQRGGTFLDVGAFQAVAGSNTYRLERDFGWSGLALDANPAVAADYPRLRPQTRFVLAFVADRDQGVTTLHVARASPGSASSQPGFTSQWGPIDQTHDVPNRTLNAVLAEHAVERIDFLSMDIELSEPLALRAFDIDRYRPRLVCVEAHDPTRQWLLDYFARHGYVLVGKYLGADPLNYWFTPLPTASPTPRP